MRGDALIAQWLREMGVDCIFGVVGIPVVELANACQRVGIRFYSFRHEQSASYAASAYGYLTGKPGVCLCVSGPGVVHSLAGVANAMVNNWPLVLLGGSHNNTDTYTGAFQEAPFTHTEMTSPFTKATFSPASLPHMQLCLQKAFATCVSGRAGAVYVELHENLLTQTTPDRTPSICAAIPDVKPCFGERFAESQRTYCSPSLIKQTCQLLLSARKPLVILGKGAAYAHAENEAKALVECLRVPFLPTPMGKGLIEDSHTLCAGAARSLVLKEADVVLIVGARLNWMFKNGKAINPSARIIHIDISNSELSYLSSRTQGPHISICNDAKTTLGQIVDFIQSDKNNKVDCSEWVHLIQTKCRESKLKLQQLINRSDNTPVTSVLNQEQSLGVFGCPPADLPHLSYHNSLGIIENHMPFNAVLVSEGANTMDMTRLIVSSHLPRRRLDANTFAAMGPAMGFAIAASAVYSVTVPVVAILGDSSFGFSCVEVETAVRYRLPIVIVVINNNGIYAGSRNASNVLSLDNGSVSDDSTLSLSVTTSVTALSPSARYDTLARSLGAHSMSQTVANAATLDRVFPLALSTALKERLPVLLNVIITPEGKQTALMSSDSFFNKNAKL